jgi:hypothetical protein
MHTSRAKIKLQDARLPGGDFFDVALQFAHPSTPHAVVLGVGGSSETTMISPTPDGSCEGRGLRRRYVQLTIGSARASCTPCAANTFMDSATTWESSLGLHAKKDQFEQALGETATWDEMTAKSARVYVTSPFDSVEEVDQWPAMMDWLMDQHVRFKRAIQAVGGLGFLA